MLKENIAGVIKQLQNRNFQSLEIVTRRRKKQVIPKMLLSQALIWLQCISK
jgi:hypothetical protein